jgi:hypothetical protein
MGAEFSATYVGRALTSQYVFTYLDPQNPEGKPRSENPFALPLKTPIMSIYRRSS